MVKETVEVEKTVSEKEELVICDDCGNELDPAGKEYNDSEDEHTLHFCSECLPRFDENHENVKKEMMRDWWTSKQNVHGSVKTTKERLTSLWDNALLFWLCSSVVLVGLGISQLISGVPAAVVGIILIICWIAISTSITWIAKTVRHLRRANDDIASS